MERDALRIIVAGNRTSAMRQLVVLLRRLGYEVVSAESGAEALNLMEVFSPDLVIFDGHLSASDGFSAMEKIKQDPRWSDLPTVLMAAGHSKTVHDEYIRFGYEGLLTTPFDLHQINVLIQEYLSIEEGKWRKKLRIPFDRPVALVHQGQTRQYQALNLSEGGIYLKTDQPLSIASRVELFLPFPGRVPLPIPGVVIYQRGSYAEVFQSDAGMAVEF
ncbi:MAG: response regulator, partial [Desulfuromonadaceae bacterium]